MGRRLAGGYTSVALPARELAATTPRQRILIRGRSLIALAAVTAVLIAVAVLLPPIVPAGADLKDASQAAYARAIWPETQISLAVLMIFLPSFVYALIVRGAALGRLLIGSISVLGVALATFYVIISLESYVAKPEVVYGFVTQLKGNSICVEPFQGIGVWGRPTPPVRCFALEVPSNELRGDASWVSDMRMVKILVSPRGHVGFIAPISGALQ
jgi:hypothetical protein